MHPLNSVKCLYLWDQVTRTSLKTIKHFLRIFKTLLSQFLSQPAAKGPLNYSIVHGICRIAARTNMRLNNSNTVLLLKKKGKMQSLAKPWAATWQLTSFRRFSNCFLLFKEANFHVKHLKLFFLFEKKKKLNLKRVFFCLNC